MAAVMEFARGGRRVGGQAGPLARKWVRVTAHSDVDCRRRIHHDSTSIPGPNPVCGAHRRGRANEAR